MVNTNRFVEKQKQKFRTNSLHCLLTRLHFSRHVWYGNNTFIYIGKRGKEFSLSQQTNKIFTQAGH